jgi:hypothetical protein
MSDTSLSPQASLRSAAAITALSVFAMAVTVLRLGDLPLILEPLAALHVDRVADDEPAAGRIQDMTDRLARGALSFNPEAGGPAANRILAIDLGRGFTLLCADRGPEMQAEFLVEREGLLHRPDFDATPFNDRLAPTCLRALA